MQYVSPRPIVPMTQILETSRSAKFDARRALMLKDAHESFFLHKSLEWAYEQEMRVVFNRTQGAVLFPK